MTQKKKYTKKKKTSGARDRSSTRRTAQIARELPELGEDLPPGPPPQLTRQHAVLISHQDFHRERMNNVNMELLSFLENKIRHAKLKQKKEALQAINILKQQLKKIPPQTLPVVQRFLEPSP